MKNYVPINNIKIKMYPYKFLFQYLKIYNLQL